MGMEFWRRIQLQYAKLQSYLHCSGNIQRVHYGNGRGRIEFSKSSDYYFTRPAAGCHRIGISNKRQYTPVCRFHHIQYGRSGNVMVLEFWG
jgi:hypothetical protein